MFWPTRLTYSVMTGSSTNFASFSTSAASWRPSFTSFSVPPAILPQIPLLMLRFPIIVGSSFVDSCLLLAVWVGAVVDCLSLSVFCELEDWLGCCDCCGPASAALEVIQKLQATPPAMTARERRVFILCKPPKLSEAKKRPSRVLKALFLTLCPRDPALFQ